MISIDLDELSVMQDELRHESNFIEEMIQFVSDGGFWTEESIAQYAERIGTNRFKLMELVQFNEDGRYMVHDGHHRVVATWLGGRSYLRSDEFVLKHWNYTDYQGINFANRWVTPFDPKSEIRIPDISIFKTKAIELAKTDEEAAKKFILENRNIYAKPRLVTGVSNLVDRYLRRSDSYEDELNESRYFGVRIGR